MRANKHGKRMLVRGLLVVGLLAAVGSAVFGPYGMAVGLLLGIAWVMRHRRHAAPV